MDMISDQNQPADQPGHTSQTDCNDPLRTAEEFLSDRLHYADDVGYSFVLSLYALMTHIHEHCQFVVPYIGARAGTEGTGKTRLIQLVGSMCLHPSPLLVDPTGAALLRRIDRDHPTLLIDESEELQKPGTITGKLFNAGYKPGAVVPRAQGAAESEYNVYCPKLFGMIGDPYPVLRSRSIMVYMEAGNIAIDDKEPEFRGIGNNIGKALAHLAIEHMYATESTYLSFRNSLRNVLPIQRDREIWECLFAICYVIAPERIRELTNAAQAISSLKTQPAQRYAALLGSSPEAVTYQYAQHLARDAYQIALASGEPAIHTHVLQEELSRAPMWQHYRNPKGAKISDPGGQTLATMLQMVAGDDIYPKPVRVKRMLLRGYNVEWLRLASDKAK